MGLPFYRFFPGDYARDTRFLSLMQHGAYRLLIDEYMNAGPLPHNLERLHRICGAMSAEEKNAVEFVLTEFFMLAEGRWTHKRCDDERAHQTERSQKAAKSAESRWRSEVDANAMRTHMRTQCERNAIQNQISEKDIHASASADKAPPPGFVEFWRAWPSSPRKVAKATCLEVWRKRNLEAVAPQILSHVAVMRGTRQWLDGFDPAPLTYLRGRRYEDDLPSVATAGDQFAGAL
jgi:uncharacterized protein YdaU (DUF1376 family)